MTKTWLALLCLSPLQGVLDLFKIYFKNYCSIFYWFEFNGRLGWIEVQNSNQFTENLIQIGEFGPKQEIVKR
jgi:hypothetical protein